MRCGPAPSISHLYTIMQKLQAVVLLLSACAATLALEAPASREKRQGELALGGFGKINFGNSGDMLRRLIPSAVRRAGGQLRSAGVVSVRSSIDGNGASYSLTSSSSDGLGDFGGGGGVSVSTNSDGGGDGGGTEYFGAQGSSPDEDFNNGGAGLEYGDGNIGNIGGSGNNGKFIKRFNNNLSGAMRVLGPSVRRVGGQLRGGSGISVSSASDGNGGSYTVSSSSDGQGTKFVSSSSGTDGNVRGGNNGNFNRRFNSNNLRKQVSSQPTRFSNFGAGNSGGSASGGGFQNLPPAVTQFRGGSFTAGANSLPGFGTSFSAGANSLPGFGSSGRRQFSSFGSSTQQLGPGGAQGVSFGTNFGSQTQPDTRGGWFNGNQGRFGGGSHVQTQFY